MTCALFSYRSIYNLNLFTVQSDASYNFYSNINYKFVLLQIDLVTNFISFGEVAIDDSLTHAVSRSLVDSSRWRHLHCVVVGAQIIEVLFSDKAVQQLVLGWNFFTDHQSDVVQNDCGDNDGQNVIDMEAHSILQGREAAFQDAVGALDAISGGNLSCVVSLLFVGDWVEQRCQQVTTAGIATISNQVAVLLLCLKLGA